MSVKAASVARWMTNPVSLPELSVHVTRTAGPGRSVAVVPVGAAGMVGTLTTALVAQAEAPPRLTACTRYW